GAGGGGAEAARRSAFAGRFRPGAALHVVAVPLPPPLGVRPGVRPAADVDAAALAVVTRAEVDARRLPVLRGRGRPPVPGGVVEARPLLEAPELLLARQVDEQAAVAGRRARVFRLLPLPLACGRVVEPRAGVRGVERLPVLLQ